MWADQTALLRTIVEHPHDDTPRLVYADWLEESDEEKWKIRAEFIRLDIELARSTKENPISQANWKRHRELLMTHVREWWRELPTIRGLVWGWYDRGFVESVMAETNLFIEHAPSISTTIPLLRLKIFGFELEHIETLRSFHLLQQLLHLEIIAINTWSEHRGLLNGDSLAPEHLPFMEWLLSPQLQRLESLALRLHFRIVPEHQITLNDRFGSKLKIS